MNTEQIIRQVAEKNGVTPNEVEREMKKAIKDGMSSTDPMVQAEWKKIAPDGKEVTIEQFLLYMIGQIVSLQE